METLTCKHCGCDEVVKYGKFQGIQRYWCKRCRRKFTGVDSLMEKNLTFDLCRMTRRSTP